MKDDDAILLLLLGWWAVSSGKPSLTGDWVYPVPDIAGAGDAGKARVTNGFAAPKHKGVDIMYVRVTGNPNSPGDLETTYYAPEGTPVLAARAGTVWSATLSTRGWQVVIDHGDVATYYQHLAERPLVSKGDRVVAGTQIGVMGADPTDPQHLRHLHFEVWRGGPDAAFDASAAMLRWPHNSWDYQP